MSSLKGRGGGGGGGGVIESDTVKLNAVAKGIYIFSEGPVEGLSTGDAKSIYLNDVPVLDSTGKAQYAGVSWTWRNGLPDQDYISGFTEAVTYQNDGREVFKNTPVTVTIANGSQEYDAAYIVIQVPVWNVKTDSGNYRKLVLAFNIDVRAAGGAWTRVHTVSTNQKSSAVWEGTYRVDLPQGVNSWEIRVTRVSDDSMDEEDSNGWLRSYRTIISRYATVTSGKFSYRNTAVLGMQFDAKTFGTSIPSVRAKIKGIRVWVPKNYDPITRTYATSGAGTSGGIWDGTFKAAWTNNPAWIYYDLLVNNRYGLGDDFCRSNNPEDALVDKWSLYEIAQYCDGLVPDGKGGTEPRYTCNLQVTVENAQAAYDVLQSLLSTVQAMIYFSNNQVVAVQDKPDSVSNYFSQTDVVDGTFNYSGTSLKNRNTVYTVGFNDEESLFKPSVAMFEYTAAIERYGYRQKSVSSLGCTRRSQAIRAARWQAYTEHLQTQTVNFTAGQKGGLVTPGEVIRIYDSYKSDKRYSGRFLDQAIVGSNRRFTLDAPLDIPVGSQVIYYDISGVLKSEEILNTGLGVTYVNVANTATEAVEGSIYCVATSDYEGSLWRVLSVADQGDGSFDIVALQHNDSKYGLIESDLILPDPTLPIVSAAALSPVETIAVEEYYEEVSGARSLAKLSASWNQPKFPSNYSDPSLVGQIDFRVSGYQVEFKTPEDEFKLVYNGSEREWTSPQLESASDLAYQIRVRAYDDLGRYSRWTYTEEFFVNGKDKTPNIPINPVITSVINGLTVTWTNPSISDYKHTEVRFSNNNDFENAFVYATVNGEKVDITGLTDDGTRHVWLVTVTHALVNNRSTPVHLSGSRAKVQSGDISDEAKTDIYDLFDIPEILESIGDLETTVNEEFDVIIGQLNESVGDLQAQIDSVAAQVSDLANAPLYSDTQAYEIGDIVKYDAGSGFGLYRAIAATTGNEPTDTAYWEKLGDYASIGDLVSALSVSVTDLSNQVTELDGDLVAEATERETLATQLRGSYTGTNPDLLATGLVYQEKQARVSGDAANASLIQGVQSSIRNARLNPNRLYNSTFSIAGAQPWEADGWTRHGTDLTKIARNNYYNQVGWSMSFPHSTTVVPQSYITSNFFPISGGGPPHGISAALFMSQLGSGYVEIYIRCFTNANAETGVICYTVPWNNGLQSGYVEGQWQTITVNPVIVPAGTEKAIFVVNLVNCGGQANSLLAISKIKVSSDVQSPWTDEYTEDTQYNATVSAISSLNTSVTNNGNAITSIGNQITTINNEIDSLESGKADASALNALSTTVSTQGGNITSNSNAITQLQNSYVATDVNLLFNSEFMDNLDGWYPAWNGNTGTAVYRGRNFPDSNWWGVSNNIGAKADGSPAAGTVFDIYAGPTAGEGLDLIRKYNIPVNAGQRLFGSCYAAIHRAAALQPCVQWLDGNGTAISEAAFGSGGYVGGGMVGDPQYYTRVGGFVTAPSGAKFARIFFRVVCDGNNDPYGFVIRPMVSFAGTNQTAWPEYKPGNGNVPLANSTVIQGLNSSISSINGTLSSHSSTLTSLSNSITDIYNNKADASALNSLSSTVSSINGTVTANSNSITSLTATVNGHTGSISTLQSVTATQGGAIASFVTLLKVGDSITGFINQTDGSTSSFKVLADNFIIASSSTGQRTEYSGGNWRVYDSAGNLRVQMGVW